MVKCQSSYLSDDYYLKGGSYIVLPLVNRRLLEVTGLVVVAVITFWLGHTIIIKTRGPNRHTRTAKALNWIANDITADWYLASVAT